MEGEKIYWEFPERIEIKSLSDYLRKVDNFDKTMTLVMDLRETESVHSSFIGLLIYLNRELTSHGGELVLKISESLKKIFIMMNVFNYFSNVAVSLKKRKTA